MTVSDIEFLFKYNRWANQRTFDVSSKLEGAAFTKPLGTSFATVHGTLAHIVGAEWVWLERWNGASPRSLPGLEALNTLEALRNKLSEVEAGQQTLIASLSEESLGSPLTYTSFSGELWTYPLGVSMQHLVNHSSYHRGQVTTLLRQLGSEAVSTDLLRYVDALNA
jgi:uncharacterized damage-inducible protein DinB